MAFCKDCAHWRTTTYDPKNTQIGVCQIDGREKDDNRYACAFIAQKRPIKGTLNLNPTKRF